MGFRIDIEGMKLEAESYSVSEAATPLAAGDSSGQVGTFSISVPVPDEYVPLGVETEGFGYGEGPYGQGPYGGGSFVEIANSPWRVIRQVGPQILIDKSVRIEDPRKGFTLGTINSSSESRDGGTIQLSGTSRLGSLNVYGIQAQPFVGTLRNAFEYYLSLAEITTDLFVDDEIADRAVVFPGWTGELWYNLKMMAAAQDCDVSLVSGIILLRAIRKRIATSNRDTSRSVQVGSNTLARAVEVYQYNNRPITNELVYPPGGWTPEVEVMTVNAGETTEYTLELSASVSSIEAPVMQTSVTQDHSSSSVYTIVADDGLAISPALWSAYGGSLSVAITPDTSHLKVTLRGATGIPTTSGIAAQNFSVALGSDTTGNRYSTFRIVGSGVGFSKVKKRIRTGVPESKTSTDVGVTIDNPFISTVDDLYRAGTRAAKQFAGVVMSLSGNVIAINRRGDSGSVSAPTYGQVQTKLMGDLGGSPTYGQVQTHYTGLGLTSYADVREYWLQIFRNDDVDQVFGNAQGARLFDKRTRRWYRIRDASLTPGGVNIQTADDDLVNGDIQSLYNDLTYSDVQTILDPFTYREVDLAGMWRP